MSATGTRPRHGSDVIKSARVVRVRAPLFVTRPPSSVTRAPGGYLAPLAPLAPLPLVSTSPAGERGAKKERRPSSGTVAARVAAPGGQGFDVGFNWMSALP